MKTTKILSGVVGRKAPHTQTLWTIQRVEVWHKLIRQQSISASANFIETGFIRAYNWLVSQMKNRIEGYSGRYPWWAYEHCPNIRSHTDEPGLYVLLQLNLDPARFLLSSYGA